MTWLITGGSGQLGKALSLVLNERKIDFVAWGSKEIDIRSVGKTLDLVGALKPSVVVNAAAWTDVDAAESNVDAAHAVNAEGVRNLVLAAKKVDAVFVQVSTDYVFSGIGSSPWKEHDVREPTSIYGKTKLAGENEVFTSYSERSFIFRTAWLYSRWGNNFAKTMTKLAIESKNDVRVVNDQVGQPTFAIDLANQIVDSVVQKTPFGTYHSTNSHQASWFEFAQEIFKLVDADASRVIPVAASEFSRPAKRPAYSVLGHDAWKATTVPAMRNWRIALAEAMPAIIAAVKAEG
jgi:dTDP-4-dehydrorhamnose reductase